MRSLSIYGQSLRFSKSPLTEAVLDIQVKPRGRTYTYCLEDIQKGHEAEYPTRQNRMYVQGVPLLILISLITSQVGHR